MLNKQQMKKIARNECMKMLGEELVLKHKDLCCSSYGISDDDGLFHYSLGMDTKQYPYEMGEEKPMEFYAFVVVNPETGTVTRDYQSSTLPQ